MIKYSLVCTDEHQFESWFPNSEAFETQSKRGLIACPLCNSTKVSKAIMSPNVARKDRPDQRRADLSAQDISSETLQDVAVQQPVALLDERAVALRGAIRELREKIIANSVDVGGKFPEEARKMHEGDTPARSIYGQATLDEARELIEDGIPLMPIPELPEDRN